jgi:Domain of unknown function (DUF4376)
MISVAYVDSATGLVGSLLNGPTLDGMPQPQYGQFAVITDYSGPLPAQWNGTEVIAIPAQPSPAHTWDWTTKTWVLDIAKAKAKARARIKAARAAAITAPLVTPHGTFQCDAFSASNILKVSLYSQNLAALGEPSDVEFTLADNSRPTFTVDQITSVAMAMGSREAAAYAIAQGLLSQIDDPAITTQTQLDAVVWPV